MYTPDTAPSLFRRAADSGSMVTKPGLSTPGNDEDGTQYHTHLSSAVILYYMGDEFMTQPRSHGELRVVL